MTETPSPTMYHVKDIMDMRWFTEDRAKAEAIGAESGCPVEPFYDRAALDAARSESRREALEDVLRTIAAEREGFKDPAYAGGPSGAFNELFACNEIERAIRALIDEETDR